MAPTINKNTLTLLFTFFASVQSAETVWSVFAYVNHGERTPLRDLAIGDGSLTPLGAQQMFSQGSLLRNRWLINTTQSDTDSNNTDNAPIAAVGTAAIDNNQLSIWTTRDDHITAGAQAFMQGLYPPKTRNFADANGGIAAAMLANGSVVDFPLGGYMYPNFRTLSLSDTESVWLEGHTACTEYWRSTSNLKSNPRMTQVFDDSLPEYQLLWSTVFNGTFPANAASFYYAYDLYEYAAYHYIHNSTIRNTLDINQLKWLRDFANIQQFSLNGDLTASGRKDGDMIRAIAGRTLSAKVVSQFQQLVLLKGGAPQINLMFGSFQPMLSFFSLSELSTGHSSGLFQEIPGFGGAMIFELFSEGTDATRFPDTDDLWVRFLYRNGSSEENPIYEYPLFSHGNSETRIKYRDFVSGIREFSINNIPAWCTACDAVNFFCSASRAASGGSTSSHNHKNLDLSPAAAGAIGAAIAIAIGAVAAVLLFVFGFGIQRRSSGRNSVFGGFRGQEKMASDRDVSITKSGAKHERVGSWELGAGTSSGPTDGPSMGITKGSEPVIGATHLRDIDDDGDSLDIGRQPIKPHETV
ncbi:hypothetical protein PFICI_03691 [Pestalotiopsis fici W106-1]|uniref:Acid phosphatase n=1 Tax=Pestalotiopsis fici (strain W106-1 / CGMCC3.15140) TaxID=1229662 RepID=W3XKA3_PESFW|nr:uncharacterized protein PFICI_03691 [Pestalotiopsis fici W106-1]ETS85666.1 hypothetical protein PFICI_03691 [Pestalotiopsis fici W106-1]